MTRAFRAVTLACAFALVGATAYAKPRHKIARHDPQTISQCGSDNSGRMTCQGTIIRASEVRRVSVAYDGGTVVSHPEGCPWRLFCGCGVSVKAFGKPIRELFLASNYGRYFNRSSFGADKVAWRPGHVVYILGGTQSAATIYDPNSGGHLTRIHVRDLSQYNIVDPRNPKQQLAQR